MKKIILIGCLLFSWQFILAQQNPTGAAAIANDWRRGGNTPGGGTGFNNIFGTFWNSPIHTYTNSVQRTRLNGTTNYFVNGYFGNRDGYMLLGQNDGTSIGTLYGTASAGAFTLLHLNGINLLVSYYYIP